MKYAPIIIPTLNRIEHLKRCITSLQRNAWAKYTPLIISVDYPPEQKYVSGYKQVCQYLSKEIGGFESVEVIYQQHNRGAYDNAAFLIDYIKRKYDRYIFSEDDNEFSPNFIEYIDKGLFQFENDENIIAVCSSNEDIYNSKNDTVALSQYFAAYGYGTWIKKRERYSRQINRKDMEKITQSIGLMLKLAFPHPGYIFALQSIIFKKGRLYQLPNGEVPIIDQTITMYMMAEGKYVLVPYKNKTRNWGYDGSGENCGRDNTYHASEVAIDDQPYFQLKYSYPLRKVKLRGKYSIEIICRIVVAFIKIEIWRWRIRRKR